MRSLWTYIIKRIRNRTKKKKRKKKKKLYNKHYRQLREKIRGKKKGKESKPASYKKYKRGKNIRDIIGLIGKLYNHVVYIRSLANCITWFIERTSRIIPLNNRTRWNSWFNILNVALEDNVKAIL